MGILEFLSHQGIRFIITVSNEDRIISETFDTFRFSGYRALYHPFMETGFALFIDIRNYTVKTCTPVVAVFHLIADIVVSFRIAHSLQEPGGIDAWLSVKEVDLDAAVISQSRQMVSVVIESGFDIGILLIGTAVFYRFGIIVEILGGY